MFCFDGKIYKYTYENKKNQYNGKMQYYLFAFLIKRNK